MSPCESGRFAATLMGITMTNRKTVAVQHIIEFKDILQILLILSRFIPLTARPQRREASHLGIQNMIFPGIPMLDVHQIGAAVRAVLRWYDRVFMTWITPGGIVSSVAASILPCVLLKWAISRLSHGCPWRRSDDCRVTVD